MPSDIQVSPMPSIAPSSVENRTPHRLEYVDEGASVLSELEVDLADYVDLLPPASRVLYELRIQLVRVEVLPKQSRCLYRFFLVEFDGARLDERRRREVRAELGHLLEPFVDTPIAAPAC